MRRLAPLCFSALALLCGCAGHPAGPATPAPAQPLSNQAAHSPAAAMVEQSARTLRELRAATRDQILDEAILGARAVIVLPGVYQAGFMYSVQGGNGVLIARRDDGGWGSPVFVNVAGAGYGWQAGLEKSRQVLAIMEEEPLARILQGEFTFDAFAMYDALGAREQTGTGSLAGEQPIMVFADGVGLMAGVAIRSGVLTINRSMTQAYHGAESETGRTIRSISAPGLEVFDLWSALGVARKSPAARSENRPEKTR